MKTKNKTCPLCGPTQTRTIFTKGKYSVQQCSCCSLARLDKIPSLKELKKLYTKDYFRDKKTRAYLIDAQKRLKLITQFIQSPAFLLDYGCGLGYFLKAAREAGFKVAGCDLSGYAAAWVEKTYGIKTYSNSLKKISSFKERLDAVTCWDVIEHVPNFMEMLKTIRRILKKKGWLFLTTPNLHSLEARLLGGYWYGYKKIPEHLYFFSPQSISLAFKKTGFKLVTIKRGGFVRDWDFILEKTAFYLKPVFAKLGFLEKTVYLPLVDMLAVAQRL